ncbi:putative cysteine dioxygenase [Aspergillus saccharolyticus JOP 1030-1]|uniref:Cysteine dioxygenase n=1 Tax=Aspergillus saccharolyticus JOP 1030-1 TaxID=1450539 RepID=A0A318Z307_9EURO|nr:cysteine dioxygenase type I [Aspergillus saccharolyticus JOP 1030-1]PYH40754.1 cysteine dioxygenase type I [Aspergillus saccharolyticus JOP 1030-1]
MSPTMLASNFTPSPITKDSITSPKHGEYTFDLLVQDLRMYLGSSRGIDADQVDHRVLMAFMSKYTSNPSDWSRFARNDSSKNYTRNLVANINGQANLLVLVWNPEKGSPIHDHANAHCIMKILAGHLNEAIYHTPDPEQSQDAPLKVKQDTTYGTNDVAYICDQIGLHRVMNPHSNQLAVSLHLYTPPNAADFGYNIYDRESGRRSHVYQA